MHIADGILSVPVIAATSALALAGVGIGLAKVDHEDIPQVGVMAAVFFVTSLIHINIGPVSVHLMLTGLLGLLLGWTAFPALAVASTMLGSIVIVRASSIFPAKSEPAGIFFPAICRIIDS